MLDEAAGAMHTRRTIRAWVTNSIIVLDMLDELVSDSNTGYQVVC